MITLKEIEAAKTPAGGWTKKQLAEWGVPWPPPKGWKEALTSASFIAIPIEKGVAIPAAKSTCRKYPIESMAVGDFFFAPISKSKSPVNSTISVHCAKHPGAKFTTRKMTRDGVIGIGVWRVEDVPIRKGKS